MSDRELLELAAKASGIDIYWRPCASDVGDFEMLDFYGPFVKRSGIFFEDKWNPLTDDGDALRLAVKLAQIDPTTKDRRGTSFFCMSINAAGSPHVAASSGEALELVVSDAFAATRRAIVRAAAQIGQSM